MRCEHAVRCRLNPCPHPPAWRQVDVARANERGIKVVRVPAYSPRSVAEHAFALSFALAR